MSLLREASQNEPLSTTKKIYILRKDSTPLDPHGQPHNRYLNRERLAERSLDELIGVCRGVIADGTLNLSQAQYLLQWMERNRFAAQEWPACVLYPRIREMLIDQVLDASEEQELLSLLHDMTGEDVPVQPSAENLSTLLPFTSPVPEIQFSETFFCFTGKFAYGTRRQCETAVLTRGALPQKAPTTQTNYLVIGTMGSTDWIHSTHGRKIESAVAFRDRGIPVAIVSEQCWVEALEENS